MCFFATPKVFPPFTTVPAGILGSVASAMDTKVAGAGAGAGAAAGSGVFQTAAETVRNRSLPFEILHG